jgi:hypothetical protein
LRGVLGGAIGEDQAGGPGGAANLHMAERANTDADITASQAVNACAGCGVDVGAEATDTGDLRVGGAGATEHASGICVGVVADDHTLHAVVGVGHGAARSARLAANALSAVVARVLTAPDAVTIGKLIRTNHAVRRTGGTGRLTLDRGTASGGRC